MSDRTITVTATETTPKKFVNLFREPSNIDKVMAGPWVDIRVETVAEGQSVELESTEVEHAAFVLSGTATLTNGDGKIFELSRSSAFAIPKTGRVSITATTELSFLHIEMRID
jgi:mannose-6-phosphate isomerase-like protein (cupin superfamily)